jgi:bifunctional non-homologous end joining protein LigD
VITHPEKVLFPADGITKGELAAYYDAVSSLMLPHIRRRPITMERFPAGIGQKGFLQKNVATGFPEWLKRTDTPRKSGGTVHYPLANDRRSLLWLVNQNTVAMHVWTARVPRLGHPDVCVFDLDPTKKQPKVLQEAVLLLRDGLKAEGCDSWVKTSGSKGFHVIVLLAARTTYKQSEAFAKNVAAKLAERYPKIFTVEFFKDDRGGRILIDTMRNRSGSTFVAPYSVRPRDGAPVSAPCTWKEIESGRAMPQAFTVKNMAARIAKCGDVWAELVKPGAPRFAV